ncbi:MAG: serine hydrolase domain-containing protein [Pseudomonadota bacterium]
MALAQMGGGVAGLTLGSGAQAQDLSAIAEEALRESGAPGLGLAWLTRESVAQVVVGRAWRGGPEVTEAARWHLGSLGKAVTGTLAARLVEQKQLAWNTRLDALFGPGAYGEVTLDDLLRHQARLPANLADFSQFTGEDTRAHRREAVEIMRKTPPVAPGFHYSNAGYVLAAAMMEAVTDTGFEALLAQEIFEPLGLASAGFGPPQDGPQGHRVLPLVGPLPVGRGPRADNPPFYAPAGTLHMSLSDYVRFVQEHLRREPGFLTSASWSHLHTARAGESYALGWGVSNDGRLGHSGSNTLWYARVAITPKDRGLVLVTNSGDGTRVERAFDIASGRLGGP